MVLVLALAVAVAEVVAIPGDYTANPNPLVKRCSGGGGPCKRSLDCCKSTVYCVVYVCNENNVCENAAGGCGDDLSTRNKNW